jgi:Family of unknown function (DUF6600)/FecR protein
MSSNNSGSYSFGLRASILLVAAFFLLQAAPFACADSNVRIVRLSFLSGDVQVDRGDSHGFDKAILNMPVVNGSRVWTRTDAQAEIEFEDGSTVRLAPDSLLSMQELRLTTGGDKITRLSLDDGTAYFDIQHHDKDVFQVSAGRQDVTLLHSARYRIKVDHGALAIAVFKGDLQMSGSYVSTVEIRKGETLTINSDEDAGRYFLAKDVVTDAYDDWDKQRRDYRDHYAARSNGYSSGFPDLTYYGSFFNATGYGTVWRPYNTPLGWDPFLDGAWVYYPPFGYTFVSAYPWGWTPYRYGHWIWITNSGWCWQPGNNWNTWTPTPTVVTTIGGPRPPHLDPPRPPATGGGGSGIIVVGRGPNTGVRGRGRLLDGDDEFIGPRRRDRNVVMDGASSAGVGGTSVAPAAGGAHYGNDTVIRHPGDDQNIKSIAPSVATPAAPSTMVVSPTPSSPRTRTLDGDDGARTDRRNEEMNRRRADNPGGARIQTIAPSASASRGQPAPAPVPAYHPSPSPAPMYHPSPAPSPSPAASRSGPEHSAPQNGHASGARSADPK